MVNWGWLENDRLREIVKRALNKVKNSPFKDFELAEIGVPWWEFRKLIYDYDLFEVTLKSRAHTFYRFKVPIEEVEKKIREYEELRSVAVTVPEESKAPDIPPDFWDTIEGYDDIKEVFIASLKADKPVHILLVGPPATAKSLMLMEVERLSGSVFITAGTATKVGIRDLLVEKKPRILIIDELDKISSPDDVSVLLTLMESGRVIVTKHKEHREIQLKTWVFAASNDTKRLPPELLDRFQVFYLRPYDKETLRRVIVKCLTRREGVPAELAEYIADKVVAGGGTVRDAIRLARLSKTKEDVDKYYEIMKKYNKI